jgi:hypothetical protein
LGNSEGDYNYTILTDLIPPTEYCGQMIFDVKAEGNAFIALLSGNDDSGPLYEIAFGMNGGWVYPCEIKGTYFSYGYSSVIPRNKQ